MDYQKYVVSREGKDITLDVNGEELKLKVRSVPWSLKNSIISRCSKFVEGALVFDGDAYVKESLKYMIVEAPWGQTTEVFLSSINEDLGGALESLVPRADSKKTSNVDSLKKE